MSFLLLSISAHAETLPTLAAVQSPEWSNSSTVADDKFPEYLEKNGDYLNAILEWRRVIYTSNDKNFHKRALFNIAELYQKQGLYKQSIHAYQNLLTQFPKTKQQPQALYQISRLSDLIGDDLNAGSARSRLLRLEKESDLATEAELHNLWAKGLKINDTFISPQTEKGKLLRANLDDFPVVNTHKTETATILSLIPGLGYVYLGRFNWGILALMLNISFFYAVMTSMKSKHWGYGLSFGTFAAFVYIGNMFHAGSIATQDAYMERLNAMETWQELQPKDVMDFKNTPLDEVPSVLDKVEGFQMPPQAHSKA
tara:strand:- start:66624 stop:67559 length:936 start_codon:yes stop_codon:yes gene_type:complete